MRRRWRTPRRPPTLGEMMVYEAWMAVVLTLAVGFVLIAPTHP